MKRYLLLLFLLAAVFTPLISAEVSLPVLKVSYSGSLNNSTYIDGEMTLEESEGNVLTLPAKFKTRGATALRYTMKPSLNMKLETPEGEEIDTDLLNIRKASSWILDAMAIDRICMRNRVCFDIWNEYSRLPYPTDFDSRNGTDGRFVIVYINNKYKGIYCLSDKINRKLLDLKKVKEEGDEVIVRGVLYKNGTNDIANQNVAGFYNDYLDYVARYHDAWELHYPDEYPSPEAWQPLLDYYDNYNNSWVEANFYEDNLVDYSLLIMALCIQDNWGYKNKYFSMRNFEGDEEDRKFIVTPWDLDTSLGGHYNGDYYNGNYAKWTMSDISKTAILPFSICFTSAGKAKLKARWADVRQTAFSVESVSARLYGYCDLFEESGAWQEYVDYWNSRGDRPQYVTDLRAEIDLIVEWYANRFKQMDDYFGTGDAGVDIIEAEPEPATIYNLQGIPVDPSRLEPGTIYIRGGKKFLPPL